MPAITFDTLKFSKALREAGVPEKQADAEATVLAEVFSINFRDVTTKDDLKHAVEKMDTKIDGVEERLKGIIRESEQRTNAKIDGLDAKIDAVEQRSNAKNDKLSTELSHIKWMLGALMTIVLGTLARSVVLGTH